MVTVICPKCGNKFTGSLAEPFRRHACGEWLMIVRLAGQPPVVLTTPDREATLGRLADFADWLQTRRDGGLALEPLPLVDAA